jgi:hypothetical protein
MKCIFKIQSLPILFSTILFIACNDLIEQNRKNHQDYNARKEAEWEKETYYSDSLFKPYEFEGVIIAQERLNLGGVGAGRTTIQFTFLPTLIQPDPSYRPTDKFFDFSKPDSCKVYISYENSVTARSSSDEEDPSWIGEKIYKRAGKVYVIMSRGNQLDSLFLDCRPNHPYFRNEYRKYKP